MAKYHLTEWVTDELGEYRLISKVGTDYNSSSLKLIATDMYDNTISFGYLTDDDIYYNGLIDTYKTLCDDDEIVMLEIVPQYYGVLYTERKEVIWRTPHEHIKAMHLLCSKL